MISVVVTTYNDAQYLARCLGSIFAQTVRPSEVIVIDDGSTHDLACIDRAKSLFPEAIFIRQDNAGPSAARNAGISRANGRFITFVDADDWLAPDNFQSKLALFDPDVVAVYGGWVGSDGTRSRFRDLDGTLPRNEVGISVPGGLHQYMFRTVPDLDPGLFINEDFDCVCRLRGRVRGNNSPLYHRTIRPNSWSRASNWRRFTGSMKFLGKARREAYFTRRHLALRYCLTITSFGRGLIA